MSRGYEVKATVKSLDMEERRRRRMRKRKPFTGTGVVDIPKGPRTTAIASSKRFKKKSTLRGI